MTVYRDYDQAALDAQYNLRAKVPDHGAFFDRWARDGEAARRRLRCRLDVPYGKSAGERLDIFPAASGGASPVLVFIHGGYWQAFDKADFSYLAPAFVEAGIAFVAINYTLAPQASMDEIVAQARRAVAWTWQNAGGFAGDPGRILVSGHSAGGHLTAMVMATPWAADNPIPGWRGGALPADLVRGGCAISGLFDLEPIRLCYLNRALGLDAAEAARNSPLRHLPDPSVSRPGPLILSVGGAETDEFRRQQATFAAAWQQGGLPLRVVEMPGLHHFSIIDAFGRSGSPLFGAVRALAGR